MGSQQQPQIMAYFLEEAKEHLDTIEQGLNTLSSTVQEPETLQEIFRAAHSIKGSAAMLELESISTVGAWLEDGFKALQEQGPSVDLELSRLFTHVFRALRDLIAALEGPEGLTPNQGAAILGQVEPTFQALATRLGLLVADPTAITGGTVEADGQEFVIEGMPGWTSPAIDEGELNTLSELLGGDGDELDLAWEQGSETDQPAPRETEASVSWGYDFADLFDDRPTPKQPAPIDEFASLFSDDLDAIAAQGEATDPDLETLTAGAATNLNDLGELLGDLQGREPEDSPTEDTDELTELTNLLDPGAASHAESSQGATSLGEELDDLLGLDDILGDETAPTNITLGGNLGDLEALPNTPAVAPPMTGTEDAHVVADFGDLEAMLQDTEQTLGEPPSATEDQVNKAAPRRSWVGDFALEQTMRVSVRNLDNLSNLAGELVVNRNSLEENQRQLRQFLENLLHQVQQFSNLGQHLQDLYERSLLESSLLVGQSTGSSGTDIPVHTTGADFDALELDRFTAFHTLSQKSIELTVRVREAASDIEYVTEATDQLTRSLRQTTTQLQEGLNRSRMVPFSQIADRLPRAVRDIALKCGKQAELLVEGQNTPVDRMLLEHLYDPFTHLINNAIIHGIEDSGVRQAKGKPANGKIYIQVFYQGNQTIISISDDGGGIDTERIKAKAVKKGLISEAEAKTMSDLEAADLIFYPGLSTQDEADDFSGRGVGMDVVRTALSGIRGEITIDSKVDRGTTFTIRLPLTLSISKALCCVGNHARIAFPADRVEAMLDVPMEQIQTNAEGQSCISWQDRLLPFYPVANLLQYHRQLGRSSTYSGAQTEEVIFVVVLRGTGSFLALQVDQVLGEQEILIKQLEAPIRKPVGVAGATVLGDGTIMPIVDVLELIDLATSRIRRDGGSPWEGIVVKPPATVEEKKEPMVLIVDDSITVRELLSLTLSKAGYRVEQARDGQEAWDKLCSGLPCDLVFCDIEMPRMDGLALLSRLQKDDKLQHLPVAMLTSRGADHHRQVATQLGARGYFTKPYLEETLLNAAQQMLKGEILVSR